MGDLSVAVVSGLSNARQLMTDLEEGRVHYDFVEVMACPGGCAGGGGQPIHDGTEMAEARGNVLWNIDKKSPVRFSHENPEIQTLYRSTCVRLSVAVRTICSIRITRAGRCPTRSKR